MNRVLRPGQRTIGISSRVIFILISLGALVVAGWACLPLILPSFSGLLSPTETPSLLPTLARPTATVPGSVGGIVWIDLCDEQQPSPNACRLVSPGLYRANGIRDASESGLAGVLVSLGLGPCPAPPLATAKTGSDGRYRFDELVPGTYCVVVDASHTQNAGLSIGEWTSPTSGGSPIASQTVSLASGEALSDVDFGWDHRPHLPATATVAPPEGECSDRATFMADVTLSEATTFPPGTPFIKTWRVLNTGTCTWTVGYALIFASGEQMNGPAAVPLTDVVPPGSPVDLSVTLVAPETTGTFVGQWQLRNDRGEPFGVGTNADQPVSVEITVSTATPTPTTPVTPTVGSGAWQGEYFTNKDLTGTPAFLREDPVESDGGLKLSWGLGRPAASLPEDQFSVRWTRSVTLETGLYRFHLLVDDGARLFVDGTLVVDQWQDGGRREVSVDHRLLSGPHTLRLEYYEGVGEALAELRMEVLSFYPDWKAQYWANTTLEGSPVLVRNEVDINFTWGGDAPHPAVPVDNYSVRWTREAGFEAAMYRFHVLADDGARVWLDDQLILDAWTGGVGREVTADYAVVTGTHTVRVEYVEYTEEARVKVWWEQLPPASYTDWKGEYWSNAALMGPPSLVRNDAAIDFTWAEASPAPGMSTDKFSARWSRSLHFDSGVYRFFVQADDGARLSIDGQQLINEWHDNEGNVVFQADRAMNGNHQLLVEYYENNGEALIKVWWSRVGD